MICSRILDIEAYIVKIREIFKRNNDQCIEKSTGKKKSNIFQNISIEKRKTADFLENLHLAAGFIMCTLLSKRTFLN